MSLFNKKCILQQSQTDEAPNFMYALLQQRKWSVSSLASTTPSKPNTVEYQYNEILGTLEINLL